MSKDLYRPLESFALRAPARPSAELARWSRTGVRLDRELARALEEVDTRLALAVSSEALVEAAGRGEVSPKKDRLRRSRLLRYMLRRAGRATPFGLMSAVAIGEWKQHAEVSWGPEVLHTRTRPDMGWLMALVEKLEADPATRAHLRWTSHPGLVEHAGRYYLDGWGGKAEAARPGVTFRATPVVRTAIALAHTPIAYPLLVSAVCSRHVGATPEKAARLLASLWEQGAFFTDLRPPITQPDPLGYLLGILEAVPGAADVSGDLKRLAACLSEFDQAPTLDTFRRSARVARAIHPCKPEQPVLQVDARLGTSRLELPTEMAREIADAAALFVRFSQGRVTDSFREFRSRFEARYGHLTWMPLCEVFDPVQGLGPPSPLGGTGEPESVESARRRQSLSGQLLELAQASLANGGQVVSFGPELERHLPTELPPELVPPSLEAFVSPVAASLESLRAGDYLLVFGGGLGAVGAGRSLGRFGDLLGPGARAVFDAVRSSSALPTDTLVAGLAYLPLDARLANVALRLPTSEWEIPILGSGANGAQVLPLSDLLLGVREGRFALASRSHQREVRISVSHLLTHHQAPAVVRFLADLVDEGIIGPQGFPWGGAHQLPYLPRVQRGRCVLSLARWKVSPHSLEAGLPERFTETLARWRARFSMPHQVYLVEGDNRLFLDLEVPEHAEQLRDTLRKAPEREHMLTEALPAPHQGWLPGPRGGHFAELVVPLVRTGAGQPQGRSPGTRRRTYSLDRLALLPGEGWLYAKLYLGERLQDLFIATRLPSFVQDLEAQSALHRWFFIRYADPEPHLRLRLGGEPRWLAQHAYPALAEALRAWQAEGWIRRATIDTYEPEVARYGGPHGIGLAEELFHLDSRSCLSLLEWHHAHPESIGRVDLAVWSGDTLLRGLGWDLAARAAWLGEHVDLPRAPKKAIPYRERLPRLRGMLSGEPSTDPGLEQLRTRLQAAEAAVRATGARLRLAAERGDLSSPAESLIGSYLHMHCNRLLNAPAREEREVMQLLRRTLSSLTHHPPVSAPAAEPTAARE